MPTAWITEFDRLPDDSQGNKLVLSNISRVAARQSFSYSVSTVSAEFNGKTKFIRVHLDGVGHIKAGENPVATAQDLRMAADAAEYFSVARGHKLAVYDGVS